MSYPEKHSFCFSETREFILNGLVVPPLKIVEFLEAGRIQMANQEKEIADLKQRNEALEAKVERLPTISYYEKAGCTERICADGIYFGYIDDLNQWKKAIDQSVAKNRYELGGDES